MVRQTHARALRGPLSKLTSMIPGMSDMMGGGNEAEATRRMKRIAFIFDSMTAEELDSDGTIFRDPPSSSGGALTAADKDKGKGKVSTATDKDKGKEKENADPTNPLGLREPNKRVLRVARGSGTTVQEVEELLAQHLMFAKMAKRMGGKNG